MLENFFLLPPSKSTGNGRESGAYFVPLSRLYSSPLLSCIPDTSRKHAQPIPPLPSLLLLLLLRLVAHVLTGGKKVSL